MGRSLGFKIIKSMQSVKLTKRNVIKTCYQYCFPTTNILQLILLPYDVFIAILSFLRPGTKMTMCYKCTLVSFIRSVNTTWSFLNYDFEQILNFFVDVKNPFRCRYCYAPYQAVSKRNEHEQAPCSKRQNPVTTFDFKDGDTIKTYYQRLVQYFCGRCRIIFPSEEKKSLRKDDLCLVFALERFIFGRYDNRKASYSENHK